MLANPARTSASVTSGDLHADFRVELHRGEDFVGEFAVPVERLAAGVHPTLCGSLSLKPEGGHAYRRTRRTKSIFGHTRRGRRQLACSSEPPKPTRLVTYSHPTPVWVDANPRNAGGKTRAGYESRTRFTALGRLGTTGIPIPQQGKSYRVGPRRQVHFFSGAARNFANPADSVTVAFASSESLAMRNIAAPG